MSKGIETRAKFDKIRYANCWEDPELLLEVFNNGGKFISIASAGDNSFSLLIKNPELVYAVDLSIPQIACSELKKYAIKYLDYENFLKIIGFKPCDNRLEIYKSIEENLNLQSRYYFEHNQGIIKNGIIHQGKFEHYFQLFANKIMPLVHNQKNLTELFLPKSIQAQKMFYDKTWNNWRFKALFKVFFNKFVMGRLGRDKEFFKYVDVSMISKNIKERADRALRDVPTWNNPYVNYILLNNFDYSLPHYAKEENFKIIKQNIDALEIKTGTINNVAKNSNMKFDGFNLSDIFEYMDEDLFKEVSIELLSSANTCAKFCYWNMMVDRRISKILPQNFKYEKELSKELYLKDRAFFYKDFIIDEVINND